MRWWRSLAGLARWLVLSVVMPVALAVTASQPSHEVLVTAQIKEQTDGLESGLREKTQASVEYQTWLKKIF
jgi:hypothetical protein